MKLAIRYQSRGRKYKSEVAEMLAEAFDTEALSVNSSIPEYIDILIFRRRSVWRKNGQQFTEIYHGIVT